MIIPATSTIIMSPRNMLDYYCIYQIHNADDICIFIGVSKLPEVFFIADARANTEFSKIMELNETFILKIVSISTHAHELNNIRYSLIRTLQPHCNVRGVNVRNAQLPIVCIETGETFRTLDDASKAHDLSQSALSNHLNHRPGYKSVKGRTYRRDLPVGKQTNDEP